LTNEDLYSISYDLNNAGGLVTNQNVQVLNRSFDTNQWRIRTNTFQAFDIGLTPGSNTITLHAMDWAGNQTTSNFVYVLDYSSKTNPPVVTLYWPTNGAQISGTNFTWRGSVDDPTVTLSAQIMDASGDTNVVSGIVERNGNFWVENLPLASGTNWLTLTATDINNNVTNISITVVQSSVIMTVTVSSDVTWQTTMDVSGTINSTGYNVWVNGLETTNLNDCGGGLWGWTVQNVPVNGAGTAVFQAVAIPTGGSYTGGGGGTNSTLQNPGNPTANAVCPVAEVCPDKQPGMIYTEYRANFTHVIDCPVVSPSGVYTDDTYTENWCRGVGGNWLSTGYVAQNWGVDPSIAGEGFNWASAVWNASGCGSWSNGVSYVDDDFSSNVSGGGGYDNLCYVGAASCGLAYDYAGSYSQSDVPYGDSDQSDYDNAFVSDDYMEALAYVQGGKAVPVQYVVQFTCNATGAPWPDWGSYLDGGPCPIWTAIPYTQITMAGGRLGPDGYYYKVVPSGTPPFDVTPNFDGGPGANNTSYAYAASSASTSIPANYDTSYVTFTVQGTPHKVVIQAATTSSSATLDPVVATPFCVGQNILFNLALEPSLYYLSKSYGNWTLSGKYANYITPHGQYASSTYDIHDVILLGLWTYCFYLDAPGGRVGFGGRLYFSNGQDVGVAAIGKTSIYRPHGSIARRDVHGPPLVSWNPVWNTGGWGGMLSLGTGVNSPNDMSFWGTVQTLYSGQAAWIQIIDIDMTGAGYYDGTLTKTVSFSGVLDNAAPYWGENTMSAGLGQPNLIPLDDSPDAPSSPGYGVEFSLSCTDYLIFRPDGGVWVCLGKTKTPWAVDCHAYWPNTNIVPSNVSTEPGDLDSSSDYPKWSHVFSNPNAK